MNKSNIPNQLNLARSARMNRAKGGLKVLGARKMNRKGLRIFRPARFVVTHGSGRQRHIRKGRGLGMLAASFG